MKLGLWKSVFLVHDHSKWFRNKLSPILFKMRAVLFASTINQCPSRNPLTTSRTS